MILSRETQLIMIYNTFKHAFNIVFTNMYFKNKIRTVQSELDSQSCSMQFGEH